MNYIYKIIFDDQTNGAKLNDFVDHLINNKDENFSRGYLILLVYVEGRNANEFTINESFRR